MSIQKVSWEYIKGIPEMMNLMNMIEFSIQNAGITLYKSYPRAVALEWRSYYLETNNYMCGIYFSEPTNVVLEVNNKKERFNCYFDSFYCITYNGYNGYFVSPAY